MTGADITKRLRLSADAYERASFKTQAAQLREAADRIEALEAALRRRTDLMVEALPVLRGAGSETLADNIAFAIWHGPDLSQPPGGKHD